MGLFDSLANKALSSVLGGSQAGGLDIGKLMGMFTANGGGAGALSGLLDKVGGLGGLMAKFQSAGLGDIFASWVGNGENQPIAPEQLQSALGTDTVQQASSALGINAEQLMPLLSQFLPTIVDKLTPNGEIQAEHVDSAPSANQLQDAIASLIPGGLGGLGKLFG
ncbi:MAG: DUF937 domain-containing protein [Verrucomicrobiaceae bacterium]|nr:DUF937 domain-containing protein [Verrucomicrobiaceae bacterium]